MADIFRARGATLESNGRLLVIKRIQAAFGNNAEFLQMFKSEVQVTMRFTHPNIVQLYESGEEGGQQYIAMELVDGRNLRQVLSKLAHKQMRIPVAASCYVIEQTAAGLHYAHTFKDRITGEPLNIVHRDVSPQNIIVSYDGNVKMIDFGIAKATTNGEATRAGVIKGKLSYLSPEQVMGEVLDARSDVFALGIVLWELLTGKRLFVAEGDNEFQVLKMIESCNTFVKPPSKYNPDVPKELDEVVLRALTRDVKKRYQSADELARALKKILAVQYSEFSPSDLSHFIKKLFHDLIVEDRKQIQQLNARAEELITLGLAPIKEAIITQTGPGTGSAVPAKDQTRISNFIGNKFDKSQINGADKLEMAGQPQRQMKVARPQSAPGTGQNAQRKTHSQPTPVDHEASKTSSFGVFKAMMAVAAIGGIVFYGYPFLKAANTLPGNSTADRAPSEAKPAIVNGKTVALKFRVFPDGDISKTKVTVNAQPVDLASNQIDVPVGDLVEVVVERTGFVGFRKEFTIKEAELGDAKEWNLDVKLEPMVYGTITLSTKPALADVVIVSLDQRSPASSIKPLVLKTPIYREKLPAGNYKIMIKNEVLGIEKTIQVEIKEGKEENFPDLQLDAKS